MFKLKRTQVTLLRKHVGDFTLEKASVSWDGENYLIFLAGEMSNYVV